MPAVPDPVAGLRQEIASLLSAPALERSYWGILVRSLKDDETLYALNARKLMMPASNMKIVTLAAAADRLSWDYAYSTRLLGIGPIQSGSLQGDLVVVGSGDPTVGVGEDPGEGLFDRWAEQLKSMGVRTIEGRIVGDDNAFDDETLGAGWAWDYLGDGYATGIGALQYNENTAVLTIASGSTVGSAASVTIAPEGSGLSLRAVPTTTPADTPASLSVRRVAGSTTLDVRGAIPIGSRSYRSVSVDNPTLYFTAALRAALIAHGIEVRGPAMDIDDLADPPSQIDATLIASYSSPRLSELALRMMKASQNLYAETLLKSLAASAGAVTAASGRDVAQSVVRSWGVPPRDLIMIDGSGLSRYNLITPEALVSILVHVDRDQRLHGPFEAALPIAGRDGTLARRMVGTPAEGNARAKTGSIDNVRALSGYVTTADGEPIVFTILANNFDATAAEIDRAADAIVVRLAQFRR